MFLQSKSRTATGMQVDVMEDGVADTDLFNLKAIKVGSLSLSAIFERLCHDNVICIFSSVLVPPSNFLLRMSFAC